VNQYIKPPKTQVFVSVPESITFPAAYPPKPNSQHTFKMKFSVAALITTVVAIASAQRTYNRTTALAEGQLEKYKCL
jgi:hypothetical protein